MIGLMGLGNNGHTLYAPDGKKLIWLPKRLAMFVQDIQHRIARLSWG